MKVIFSDGIMEATEYPEGWLFLRWIDNKHGRLQKKLLKDLFHVEQLILKRGLKGWLTSSEVAHREFQMLLHKVGAQFMAKDPEYIYFNKWITRPEDIYVWKRTIRTPITILS
jgi:hypothetical protein